MMQIFAFLIITLIASSCNILDDDHILSADAVIRWTGDYAVDGCGFFIDIGEKENKAEDESVIPDSLKNDSGTTVTIKYELLDESIEFYCGWEQHTIDWIRLLSIKPL